MAKKKQDTEAAEPGVLTTTADLLADGANPRKISDESAAGLRASIKRFGDLAGIVFNKRTGELVAGHQRLEQIRAEYGDLPIELIDQATGTHGIRVSESEFFAVRVVEWSPAKQRAANVAANNPKIQGTFTGDLSTYLLSVEAELQEEMPGVLDECLMVQLLELGLDGSDATESKDVPISESYQIIVQCNNEEHQQKIYEQLTGEGLSCKVLTL